MYVHHQGVWSVLDWYCLLLSLLIIGCFCCVGSWIRLFWQSLASVLRVVLVGLCSVDVVHCSASALHWTTSEQKPTRTTHKTDARLCQNEKNPKPPYSTQLKKKNKTEINQNNTQDRCQTLQNESNPTETTDKQQRKQQTVSVKNTSHSLMMDTHCPKHVGVLTMVHSCF
jgi:hypothetical protein